MSASLHCISLCVCVCVCACVSASLSPPLLTPPHLSSGQGQVLVAPFEVTNQVSPQHRSSTARTRTLHRDQVTGVTAQETLRQAGHVTDHATARPEAGQPLTVRLKHATVWLKLRNTKKPSRACTEK